MGAMKRGRGERKKMHELEWSVPYVKKGCLVGGDRGE
jgi:hypothetical protein